MALSGLQAGRLGIENDLSHAFPRGVKSDEVLRTPIWGLYLRSKRLKPPFFCFKCF
jgi:hypothetical protein